MNRIDKSVVALREIETRLERYAESDFKAHQGKVLLAHHVDGYTEHGDSVTVRCDPPARIRVRQTSKQDIYHWCDNWLDPYWDIEQVTPHPALAGIGSLWVYGPSYCTDGRTEPSSDWTLERTTFTQMVKDWWRRS